MSSTKKWYKNLYLQVLIAIGIGIVLGAFFPATGAAMKPLGDMFIKLIKMVVAPIVFCTVVTGICGMEDMKKIGRVGGKALLYFEAVTTLALAIGLVVVNLVQPGAGMNIDPHTLDAKAVAAYTPVAKHLTVVGYLLNIIPKSIVDAFGRGDLLQVLFFSILFGFSLALMGEKGRPLVVIIEQFSKGIYGVVNMIMKVAPVGAFGAMAFTVGKYGLGTLLKLGLLMGSFYLTCAIFVFIGLGTILRLAGFSIFKFIHYIRDELLIVLGTSTTEAVLPQMMAKMENLGCEKSVVGLVIPTGYSFNLDGACIYLTMAAIFIAQATNVHLSLLQELAVLGVLLLTSKGGAGIAGSAFVVLAATLSSIGTIPVAGLTLILGIDRFMNEARALTNLVGNGVATLVVAKWENALDPARARAVLNGEAVPPLAPAAGLEASELIAATEQGR